MMSTGLLRLQVEGRNELNSSNVSLDSSVSSPPLVMSVSVARTAGPPALVRMVSLGPLGGGCFPSTSAMSNRSEIWLTRSTPLRRKAASNTSSEPVSDPVCEAAALPPAAVRPALITMIGLVRATSRAADRNDRASPIDSM